MKKIIGTLICTLFFISLLKAQTNSRVPKSESPIERLDLSVNRVNYLHKYFPDLNGNGFSVSIKEYRFDSLDLDLLGKKVSSPFSIPQVDQHATEMATIIGGRGNTLKTGKGVAPEVWLSSASFLNLSPEPFSYYEQADIKVQNHSYGLGIENYYGTEAREYDELVFEHPDLLQVFSAGNMGEVTGDSNRYAGIPQFANLTGNFKMAKNVLTIGALDDKLQVEKRSSRGPAYDGRVKPELVAYGEDGTSGAAAIVSGVGILLQQAYHEQQGRFPPAALLRSIFITSADDLLNLGPDFISGYGNLNARRALQLLLANQYWEDRISSDTSLVFEIEIPENIYQLKITLAWTDPAAEINQAFALINDLDMELSYQDSLWLPWVLDSSPDSLRLSKSAVRKADHLNNQEQISVQLPQKGKYQIKINSKQLFQDGQDFALSYQLDTLQQFTFTYPAKKEKLEINQSDFIRWDYTGPQQEAALWYRNLNSEEWQLLSNEVDLSQGWYSWQTPKQSSLSQLRMIINEQEIHSDTFILSPRVSLSALLDCGDTYLLEWTKLEEIDEYEVYKLIGDRMELEITTSDTFYFPNVSASEMTFFAVAPKINTEESGLRSQAFERDFRDPPCYVNRFSARLVGSSSFLELQLSTLYEVASIQLQKWDGVQFKLLQSLNINGLNYRYTDDLLSTGSNLYQISIELSSGSIIRSTSSVFYVPINEVLVYPNPLLSGQLLLINLPNFQGRRVQIVDAMGRIVLDYDFLNAFDFLETQNWAAGIYFYKIIDPEGSTEHQGKIFVR